MALAPAEHDDRRMEPRLGSPRRRRDDHAAAALVHDATVEEVQGLGHHPRRQHLFDGDLALRTPSPHAGATWPSAAARPRPRRAAPTWCRSRACGGGRRTRSRPRASCPSPTRTGSRAWPCARPRRCGRPRCTPCWRLPPRSGSIDHLGEPVRHGQRRQADSGGLARRRPRRWRRGSAADARRCRRPPSRAATPARRNPRGRGRSGRRRRRGSARRRRALPVRTPSRGRAAARSARFPCSDTYTPAMAASLSSATAPTVPGSAPVVPSRPRGQPPRSNATATSPSSRSTVPRRRTRTTTRPMRRSATRSSRSTPIPSSTSASSPAPATRSARATTSRRPRVDESAAARDGSRSPTCSASGRPPSR